MTYRLCYTLEGWSSLSVDEGAEVVGTLCQALAMVNRAYLRDHPETPPLSLSGVRYSPDGELELQWTDIPAMYASKKGDCKALAAARIAEIWASGRDAWPFVTLAPNGKTYHVQVVSVYGIEDPSIELGMGDYE